MENRRGEMKKEMGRRKKKEEEEKEEKLDVVVWEQER